MILHSKLNIILCLLRTSLFFSTSKEVNSIHDTRKMNRLFMYLARIIFTFTVSLFIVFTRLVFSRKNKRAFLSCLYRHFVLRAVICHFFHYKNNTLSKWRIQSRKNDSSTYGYCHQIFVSNYKNGTNFLCFIKSTIISLFASMADCTQFPALSTLRYPLLLTKML